MPKTFLKLDSDALIATIKQLRDRINARFPDASLAKIAQTVVEVAERARAKAERIRRPNPIVRAAVVLLLGGIVAGFAYIATHLDYHGAEREVRGAPAFVQFLDAALETVALLGGGAIFLMTIESRLKRRKLIAAVHELRSLAHIIDMHQLTKSPDHYLKEANRTKFSVEVRYDLYQVRRYLDYCSELLAMVSKVAMLYLEDQTDSVVLDAVDQIEDLTTSLSRKIWQKVSILNELRSEPAMAVEGRGRDASPPAKNVDRSAIDQ
jgi:hypothetical protein